jgi:hypothetical protein
MPQVHATPLLHHGIQRDSRFYRLYSYLHGKEIELPTTHGHRAELPPDIRGTELQPRLENLKSRLNLAYREARENIRKVHGRNKKYYNRKATDSI